MEARGHGRPPAPRRPARAPDRLRIEPLDDRELPSATLLLGTTGDVNNSGAPGLNSWTAGTALRFGDPNFALEPGTTTGTFSALFNLNAFTAADVDVDALHFVRRQVAVGGGANTFTLLPGDLLLSVNGDGKTLTSQNSLTVNKDDVFVFRPRAAGDYSAGTFFPLLNDFKAVHGGNDTWAIALVEAATVVGDVTLPAGSFLFARDGGAQDNDVRLFVPSGVGVGTTGGTVSVLIEGDDLGINPKVLGIDLVESATTLANQTLPAGTLLLALDANDNSVGSNGIAVAKFDVLTLTASKTTLGSGTAVANAALLFQGADVGLNGAAEALHGVTIMLGNSPPTAVADNYGAQQTTTLNVPVRGVLTNDGDPDGDPISVVGHTNPAHGTVAINGDGSFTYTPAAGYTGIDTFTYTVGDGTGATATATVTITVTAAAAPGFAVTGNSFIVSVDNHVYRLDALTGAVIADYTTGLANDGSAVGPDGSVYVADYSANQVRRYSPSGVLVGSFGTNGRTPQGLTFGPDGNLYVTTTANSVEKFSPAGAFLGTFIAPGSGGLNNAKGIVWGPDGNAYVTSYFNSQVLRYNGATGAFLDAFATGSGGFEDLTFGPDGNLYVASYGDGAVYRYRGADGAALGAFVTGVPSAFGVQFDPNGNLNVSSRSAGRIQTFDGITGAYLFDLSNGLLSPAYVTGTSSLVTTSAGGSATLRVALRRPPTADVTLTLAVSRPNQGSLSRTTLTFTPASWNVPQAVTVTGLDDAVANGDQTFQITGSAASSDPAYSGLAFSPVPVLNREVATNRAPVPTNDNYTLLEDNTFTLPAPGVLGNDSDPDGDSLTAAVASQPAHGSVAMNANGGFTYTPNPNFFGSDSFTYRVSDGKGGTAIGTVTLTIQPVNDPPSFSLSGNPPAVNEDAGPVSVPNFAFNISTGPGPGPGGGTAPPQSVWFVVTGNSNPGLFAVAPAISPTGTLTYTPALNASGTAVITVVLKDDGGTANGGQDTSPTQSFTIRVRAVNDPPTLDPIGDRTVAEDSGPQAVSLTGISAGGGESQGLQVTATSSNPAVVPNPTIVYTSPSATGTLTFTPAANANGSAVITVTVRDAGFDGRFGTADDGVTSRQFTVTVTPVNDPPAASPDAYSTIPLLPLNVPAGTGVLVNDSDPDGDALTAVLVSNGSWGTATLNPDGSFTYVPGPFFLFGTDTFTYRAQDPSGALSPVVTVTITIGNGAPAAADDSFSTPANTTLNGPSVLGNDSDPNGDLLSADLVAGPAHGQFTWNPNGTFTYTPDPNYSGTDSFVYRAFDGQGYSNPATVTLTVTPTNGPPAATDDPASTAEDTPVTIDVRANDTDPDGDTLTVVSVTPGTHGTVTTNGTTVTYTPDPDYNGADSFTYTVSDGHGGLDTATVNVTVTPVPDAPVAGADDYSTGQNVELDVPAGGVLANDTDGDGDALTASLVAGPAHGTLTFNPDGSFTYVPRPGFRGTDIFTYRVTDPTGRWDTATVTIRVIPPNGRPVAQDDDFAVAEDGVLTVPASGVLANDTPPGNLPLTARLVSAPKHGTVVFRADGSFTYTPDPDFSGTDSFSYKAVDVNNGSSGTARVQITVTATPDGPVAAADRFAVLVDTPLTAGAGGVLANDRDPDGRPLTAALVAGPAHGQLMLNADGTFTYTPAPGFVGEDTFTYQVTDGQFTAGPVSVSIVVSPAPPSSTPTPEPGGTGGTVTPPPNPGTTPIPVPVPPPAGGGGGATGGSTPVADGSPQTSDSQSPTGDGAFHHVSIPAGEFSGASATAPAAPPASAPSAPPPALPDSTPAAPPAVAPTPPTGIVPPAPILVPPPQVGTEVPAGRALPEAAANGLITGLNELDRQVRQDGQVRGVTETVVATGVVATAGYVLLSPRLALWFLGAVAARRAVWKAFDPIDVVFAWENDRAKGKAAGADDESLESMVGG